MSQPPVFEIIVTSTANCEWQGTVFFPVSGERLPFKSLLQLVKVIEANVFPLSTPDLAVLLSRIDL